MESILHHDSDLEQRWGIDPSIQPGEKYLGYLLTVNPTRLAVDDADKTVQTCSAFYLYFVLPSGATRRIIKVMTPHILVAFKPDFVGIEITDVESMMFHVQSVLEAHLNKHLPKVSVSTSIERKINTRGSVYFLNRAEKPYKVTPYLKLTFADNEDLLEVRKELRKLLSRNKKEEETARRQIAQDGLGTCMGEGMVARHYMEMARTDPTYLIADIFESDIEIDARFFIGEDIRCGLWYEVERDTYSKPLDIKITLASLDIQKLAPPLRVCAWDIETHKDPLKFPSADRDPIMCISYMTQAGGYLLVNLEYFSRRIQDFTYHPVPEYRGEFKVYNFHDEKELLNFFLRHLSEDLRPHIIVSYNGDSFDFPYTSERASRHGLSMTAAWGFRQQGGTQLTKAEYVSKFVPHMDCLRWVERDSYLPCGSRGLKAVTKAKLFYEGREVDPENMVPFCKTRPQVMAEYSVSDAVATYNIYIKYVHRFTLALSSIIPLTPDAVLRKGSGTLCEHLLMAQAWKSSVCIPNKHSMSDDTWLDNKHLLHSETYVGGNVEQLRSGIYRDDLPEKFVFNSETLDSLIGTIDETYDVWLHREIDPEGKLEIEGSNWKEVAAKIQDRLELYKELQDLNVEPMIYHLDVGAMYPNIILSQRLQPYAMVEEADCSSCVFSSHKDQCQRKLKWTWKAERYTLDRSQILGVEDQLKVEQHWSLNIDGKPVKKGWNALTLTEKKEIKTARLKKLGARLHHNKFKIAMGDVKDALVCQRAASFYVDTVRDFRDRRTVYKIEKKKAEKRLEEAPQAHRIQAENEVVMYDSLQLAHKCILNSFYGYVMRKGARWYSLEMAAVVTHTGANVIKKAKNVCAGIGIPLELDTDGVWTLLPKGFPDRFNIELKLKGEEKPLVKKFSYPCWMLNTFVENDWINTQYHTLSPRDGTYKLSSENSIFFEIDGPYKAMFLPASEKENKQLKKRYAVFDFDNRISELKGFELKRRGELQVLKAFQEDVFPQFLAGASRAEVYAAVGRVAERWLRFIQTRGGASDSLGVIMELLEESTVLSKPAVETTAYKSMGLTAASRLCNLRQDETYINQKGVKAAYVVTKAPVGEPRTARAIPTTVFEEDAKVRDEWLRKWTTGGPSKSNATQKSLLPVTAGLSSQDIHHLVGDLLDWDYYKERLTTAVQKIVIVPALNQGIPNPCSGEAPVWLRARAEKTRARQMDLTRSFLKAKETTENSPPPCPNKVTDLAMDGADKAERTTAEFAAEISRRWKEWRFNLPLRSAVIAQSGHATTSMIESSRALIIDLVEIDESEDRTNSLFAFVQLPTLHQTLCLRIEQYRQVLFQDPLDVERLKNILQNTIPTDAESGLKIPAASPVQDDVTSASPFPDSAQPAGLAERDTRTKESMSLGLAFLQGSVFVQMPRMGRKVLAPSLSLPHETFMAFQHRLLDLSLSTGRRSVVTSLSEDRLIETLQCFGSLVSIGFSKERSRFFLYKDENCGNEPWSVDDFLLLMDCTLVLSEEDLSQVVSVAISVNSIKHPSLISLKCVTTRRCVRGIIAERMNTLGNLLKRILCSVRSESVKAQDVRVVIHTPEVKWNEYEIIEAIYHSLDVTTKRPLGKPAIHVLSSDSRLRKSVADNLIYGLPASWSARAASVVHWTEGVSSSLWTANNDLMVQIAAPFKTVLCEINDYIKQDCASSLPLGLRLRAKLNASEGEEEELFWRYRLTSQMAASGLVPTSPSDFGPLSTASWIIDYDLFGHLLGGVCHDGTQGKTLEALAPHLQTMAPKVIAPGVFRQQIAHIRFCRPAVLQALMMMPELGEEFSLPMTSFTSGVVTEILENNAFFLDKKRQKAKERLATLDVDPTITRLLSLRDIVKGSKLTDTQRMSCVRSVLNLESALFDESLCHALLSTWVPLLYKTIVSKLELVSKEINQKLMPAAVWSEGILIQLPTTKPKRARAATGLLKQALNAAKTLSGLIDCEFTSHFKQGLQLDVRNCIFLRNDDEIGHSNLLFMDPLPDAVVEVLVERMMQLINEPVVRAREKTGKENPEVAEIAAEVDTFLRETWPDSIMKAFPDALETSEGPLSSFDQSQNLNSDCIGVLEPNVREGNIYNATSNSLISATTADEVFRNWPVEDRDAWLEQVGMDEVKCERLTYSVNCPIILPHLICGACGFIDDVDICDGDLTADQFSLRCVRCSAEYSEDLVEGRLVSIVEAHILSIQARDIICKKCKVLKSDRCSKWCSCGSSYSFATHITDTRLLLDTLSTTTKVFNFPWLEAVLDQLSSLR